MKILLLILLSSFQICLFNFILLKSQPLVQENKENKSKCPCLQSKIRFDVSSLEKIVLRPEDVLAHPDAFWANDSAYRLEGGGQDFRLTEYLPGLFFTSDGEAVDYRSAAATFRNIKLYKAGG